MLCAHAPGATASSHETARGRAERHGGARADGVAVMTALAMLIVVLAIICVLLVLRKRGHVKTFLGRELSYRALVRDHAVLAVAVLVLAVVHMVEMLGYAAGAQLVTGACLICALAAEVTLGVALYLRPRLRTGAAGRAHGVLALALAVLAIVHVALAA